MAAPADALDAIPCPADVTGPAYQAAYRKGWAASAAGASMCDCPWGEQRAQPAMTYRALWRRGYQESVRARLRDLADRLRVAE